MKIKKNLPDIDMLKAAGETIEKLDNRPIVHNKPVLKTIALPEDILVSIDKEAFNLRVKLKQKGIEDIKWKITTDDEKIILKPVAKDKKKF